MNTFKTVTCTVEVCPIGFKSGKECPALKFLVKNHMKGTIEKCPVRKDYLDSVSVSAAQPIDRMEKRIVSLKSVKGLCLF